MNIEYSPATGAPRILIQANPCWEQWAELAEAVWVTALEGGCNYWMDHIHIRHLETTAPYEKLPEGRHWSLKNGGDIIKNFSLVVHHNAGGHDYWIKGSIENAEVTEAKSFDVVARGINNLPPDVKMSVMFSETCDIDAEIADQIIQCGQFGSAVYG
jgi:hypothetical protein